MHFSSVDRPTIAPLSHSREGGLRNALIENQIHAALVQRDLHSKKENTWALWEKFQAEKPTLKKKKLRQQLKDSPEHAIENNNH